MKWHWSGWSLRTRGRSITSTPSMSRVSCAAEGAEVVVKLGSRHYRATIIDFLEWQPRKRRRMSTDTCAGEQPPWSSAKKNEASKGSARKTKASKSSTVKKSATLKCSKMSTCSERCLYTLSFFRAIFTYYDVSLENHRIVM